MFFIRDTVRKIKPDEKIKFPKGFLVFEMDKNKKTLSVNCIQYKSDLPVTTKTFNEVIKTITSNNEIIIEYYEIMDDGIVFSDLIKRIKSELLSIVNNDIIKVNQDFNG